MSQSTKTSSSPTNPVKADTSFDPMEFVYLPTQAITVTHNEVQRRANNTSSLFTFVPEIDARLNPAMPGEVVTVLARAKQGKTTFMVALAKLWSKSMRERPVSGKPPLLIYATWETLVEQFITSFVAEDSGQTMAEISRGKLDSVRFDAALVKALGSNFCVFGRANPKPNSFMQGSGATLLDLYKAIKILQEDYDVQAVLIDFLQIIPDLDRMIHYDKMTAIVSDNMARICNIAINLGVPVWVASQAGREVDDKTTGIKFPEMKHAQWTSSVEQLSSKVIAIAKVSSDDRLPIGGEFDVKCRPLPTNSKERRQDTYEVNDKTFGVKLLAQRDGYCDTYDNWFLEMDWANATFKLQQSIGTKYENIDSVAY